MVSKRERNKRAHLRLYGDLVDLLNKNYESGSITDSMIDSCLSPINDYEQDLIKAPLLSQSFIHHSLSSSTVLVKYLFIICSSEAEGGEPVVGSWRAVGIEAATVRFGATSPIGDKA